MGTSASSKGPRSGVSLDPAWLDEIQLPNQSPDSGATNIENTAPTLAPPARFSNARRSLGEYVRSGSKESLRHSLGHYAKTGMGGSSGATRRMRNSTRIASGFVSAFRSMRDGGNSELKDIITELKSEGASARKLIDTIVDNLCPSGGSLDEISARDSGKAALSEFMSMNPDADICNLTDDQIWTLTGMFLGNEVFRRIQIDIGQAFERQDVAIVDRVNRLNEMQEYIQAELFAQIDAVRNSTSGQTDIQQIMETVIKNTFMVYEVEV